MGHVAGPLPAPGRVARRRSGRAWTALGLALCAVAGAGAAHGQTIWDDPAYALYRQALEAMDKKDYARADELAAQAITKQPTHVLAYYVRGQAAAAQSRWDDAVAAFTKVAELYPGSFAARRDLGISLENLNRLPDAAKAYEAALAVQDQDELRARLAFLLIEAGEEPRALTQFETLTSRNSTMPEVWRALGRLTFESGELAASEKAYARAAALKDDGRTWFNLGVVRVKMQNVAGALDAFGKAARHPDVKQQAETEMTRLRDASKRDRVAPIDRARGSLDYSGPGRR